MTYVINCDCGYVARGESEEELVQDVTEHIEEIHPAMVGAISEEDLLAMAEEV